MSSGSTPSNLSPPPRYSRLPSPRPPPIDEVPEFASGRPNRLDAWDYAALSVNLSNTEPTSTPQQDGLWPTSLNDRDLFDERDLDDYLNNPYRYPTHPDRQLILKGSPSNLPWLHCHHKVFPVHFQCMLCPQHNCLDYWRIREMAKDAREYQPRCPRPRCGANITTGTVLVNAQKEDIMTVGGENLMESRLRETFVWCCNCTALRSLDGHENQECAHCAHPRESRCPDCIKCNKFLEPVRFCNQEIVHRGVLHLHMRALAVKAGEAEPNPRQPDKLVHTRIHFGDPWASVWNIMASSMVLGSLFLEISPPSPEALPLSRPVRLSTSVVTAVYTEPVRRPGNDPRPPATGLNAETTRSISTSSSTAVSRQNRASQISRLEHEEESNGERPSRRLRRVPAMGRLRPSVPERQSSLAQPHASTPSVPAPLAPPPTSASPATESSGRTPPEARDATDTVNTSTRRAPSACDAAASQTGPSMIPANLTTGHGTFQPWETAFGQPGERRLAKRGCTCASCEKERRVFADAAERRRTLGEIVAH
jgi:hypothetical protein